MAQININIPNAVLDRTLDAICNTNGYQQIIDVDGVETPNPVTRPEFAKGWIIGQIKHVVRHYESELAAKAAKAQAEQQADIDVDIS